MPNTWLTGRRIVILGSVVVVLVLGITVMPYAPVTDRNSAIYFARYGEADRYAVKVLEGNLKDIRAAGDGLITAFRREYSEASASQIEEANAILEARTTEIIDEITKGAKHFYATHFSEDDLQFMRRHHPSLPVRLQSFRIHLTFMIYRSELDRALADKSWHASHDAMFREIKTVFQRVE